MVMHIIFCTSSYKAYLKKKNSPGHGILIKKWLENLSCAKDYSFGLHVPRTISLANFSQYKANETPV